MQNCFTAESFVFFPSHNYVHFWSLFHELVSDWYACINHQYCRKQFQTLQSDNARSLHDIYCKRKTKSDLFFAKLILRAVRNILMTVSSQWKFGTVNIVKNI